MQLTTHVQMVQKCGECGELFNASDADKLKDALAAHYAGSASCDPSNGGKEAAEPVMASELSKGDCVIM